MCKQQGTQTVQAVAPYSLTSSSRRPTPATSAHPSQALLATLPLAEQLAWIAERRVQLQQKQARERAYLDRRTARGTHTPTDDAYEADQLLEQDLCDALDLLEHCLQGGSLLTSSANVGSVYAGNTSFLFASPDHQKIQP